MTATALAAQTTTPKQPASTTSTTTTTSTRATEPVTAETDADVANPRALKLTLDESLRTSMQRNLDVGINRYNYVMGGESLRSQYGLYDWFADGTFQQNRQKNATVSTFQANESRTATMNLGIGQNLPAGGNYFLGVNNSRFTTSGGGTTVSPAYNPSLAFQATQPLLRNFGLDVTRRGITIARNTLGIDQELFRQGLMDTTVSVEQAYLDLVYARRNVEVVKESLFLARDQSRITQIRIDVGASAPLDILQPRVQIATEEENLILAVAAVRNAEDRLRALMNLDPADWDRPIIPTDPVNYTPVNIDTNAAVVTALNTRPELRQAALTTATRDITYTYARNQRLPQLDFNMNYRAVGLAGRTAVFDPLTGLPTGTFTSTGYGTALQQVFSTDFPTWTFGFTLGVPVTNIGARAEAKRAQLDLDQSRLTQEQLRQNIAVQVRGAVRDVDTAAKSIAATRAA
ncbi:MAG TPA: TolC family protein, partial [Thermoanaerobaculia bacterium]